MDLLARREHGITELSRKLIVKKFDPQLVEEAIDGLVRENLLSDERFCESMINSRLNRGHGPIKVSFELRNKGVPDHIVEKVMKEEFWRLGVNPSLHLEGEDEREVEDRCVSAY